MLVRNLQTTGDYQKSIIAQDENLRLAIQNDKNIADARKNVKNGLIPEFTRKQNRISEQILTDALEIKIVALNNLRTIFTEEQANKFVNGDGKTKPLSQEELEYLNIFWEDLKLELQTKTGLSLKFFRDILKKSSAGRRANYGYYTGRTQPAKALVINTPDELKKTFPRENLLEQALKVVVKIATSIPQAKPLAEDLRLLKKYFPTSGDRLKRMPDLPADKQQEYYKRFQDIFEGWQTEPKEWERVLMLNDREIVAQLPDLLPIMEGFEEKVTKLYEDLAAEPVTKPIPTEAPEAPVAPVVAAAAPLPPLFVPPEFLPQLPSELDLTQPLKPAQFVEFKSEDDEPPVSPLRRQASDQQKNMAKTAARVDQLERAAEKVQEVERAGKYWKSRSDTQQQKFNQTYFNKYSIPWFPRSNMRKETPKPFEEQPKEQYQYFKRLNEMTEEEVVKELNLRPRLFHDFVQERIDLEAMGAEDTRLAEIDAAIKIQSGLRGLKAKNELKRRQILGLTAEELSQEAIQEATAELKEEVNFKKFIEEGERRDAAIKIQSKARGVKAKEELAKLLEEKAQADQFERLIQAQIQQQQLDEWAALRAEQKKIADTILVQAKVRSNKAKAEVARLRQRNDDITDLLQGIIDASARQGQSNLVQQQKERIFMGEEELRTLQYEEDMGNEAARLLEQLDRQIVERESATTIQAGVRGRKAQKELSRLKQQREEVNSIIQDLIDTAAAQGQENIDEQESLARKKASKAKADAAILKIRKISQDTVLRKEEQEKEKERIKAEQDAIVKIDAAIRIQAALRGAKAKAELKRLETQKQLLEKALIDRATDLSQEALLGATTELKKERKELNKQRADAAIERRKASQDSVLRQEQEKEKARIEMEQFIANLAKDAEAKKRREIESRLKSKEDENKKMVEAVVRPALDALKRIEERQQAEKKRLNEEKTRLDAAIKIQAKVRGTDAKRQLSELKTQRDRVILSIIDELEKEAQYENEREKLQQSIEAKDIAKTVLKNAARAQKQREGRQKKAAEKAKVLEEVAKRAEAKRAEEIKIDIAAVEKVPSPPKRTMKDVFQETLSGLKGKKKEPKGELIKERPDIQTPTKEEVLKEATAVSKIDPRIAALREVRKAPDFKEKTKAELQKEAQEELKQQALRDLEEEYIPVRRPTVVIPKPPTRKVRMDEQALQDAQDLALAEAESLAKREALAVARMTENQKRKEENAARVKALRDKALANQKELAEAKSTLSRSEKTLSPFRKEASDLEGTQARAEVIRLEEEIKDDAELQKLLESRQKRITATIDQDRREAEAAGKRIREGFDKRRAQLERRESFDEATLKAIQAEKEGRTTSLDKPAERLTTMSDRKKPLNRTRSNSIQTFKELQAEPTTSPSKLFQRLLVVKSRGEPAAERRDPYQDIEIKDIKQEIIKRPAPSRRKSLNLGTVAFGRLKDMPGMELESANTLQPITRGVDLEPSRLTTRLKILQKRNPDREPTPPRLDLFDPAEEARIKFLEEKRAAFNEKRMKDILSGKGLKAKPKTFVEFGRFKLNENMLEEGTLQVKTLNGSPVPSFSKKIAISDTMQEILLDLIETQKLRGVAELDDEERRLLETLIIKAGLAHGLGVKKVHQTDEDAKKVKRFDLVKGIYDAGNNSLEVIHELRSLILYFIKTKRLNRKDGIEALQELQ